MTNGVNLGQEERSLLLRHLESLRSDLIREFLRRHDVGPLGERKEQAVARVQQALTDGDITWGDLIAYLDEVEPFGKQHIYVYRIPTEALAPFASADHAAEALGKAGLASLWQQQHPLAAPESMQLGGIGYGDNALQIYAVTRRSFRKRRKDLEEEVLEDRPGLEAHVYEIVHVRTWVRFHVANSGEASLHVAQLERKADYEGTRDEFLQLISPWFPVSALMPLNLASVVRRLHEAEAGGSPEATVQAVRYDSAVGVHSALSSASAAQSVLGQTGDLDQAAELLKGSGPGEAGNFYWLPASDGGLSPGNPLTERVHVSVIVKDNRINLWRPVSAPVLDYLMRRIRFLSA